MNLSPDNKILETKKRFGPVILNYAVTAHYIYDHIKMKKVMNAGRYFCVEFLPSLDDGRPII